MLGFLGLVAAAAVGRASAAELTAATWDEATQGKTVFLKFYAPWCGHCKAIKPSWAKLEKKFEGHATTLVASIDCDGDGKELCEEQGIEGFPTLKYGDPADLQDFQGEREFDDLAAFAKDLGPMCSPANIDICDDAKKAQIKDLQAMDPAARQTKLEAQEAKLKKLDEDFQAFTEGLQKSYEEAETKKTEEEKAIKESGYGLMKSVHAFEEKRQKAKDAGQEL